VPNVVPNVVAFGMSKEALKRIPDHKSAEHATRGLASNTLMPRAVRIAPHEAAIGAMDDDGAFKRMLLWRHPIGRFGTVE
jgi:NAD(P)-dependent dehydrogenase (short-subunit alcohol dehydrogenase family)